MFNRIKTGFLASALLSVADGTLSKLDEDTLRAQNIEREKISDMKLFAYEQKHSPYVLRVSSTNDLKAEIEKENS